MVSQAGCQIVEEALAEIQKLPKDNFASAVAVRIEIIGIAGQTGEYDSMKTTSITPADIKKKWVLIDATGQSVGRLASEIARILRGKHKVSFVPHLDNGDNVVVVNASKAVFTGRKLENKFYYQHSGYVGGIKAVVAKDLLATKPERVLEHAVRGMLPHNKLGRKIFHNVKIYASHEHPHEAQKPVPATARLVKEG